jgi:hypothetical protein
MIRYTATSSPSIAAVRLRAELEQELKARQERFEHRRQQEADRLRSDAFATWAPVREIQQKLAVAHDPLPREREALQAFENKAARWLHSYAVLVRPRQGPAPSVYHVGSECGHVAKNSWNIWSYEWMFEEHAKDSGLKLCWFGPCSFGTVHHFLRGHSINVA